MSTRDSNDDREREIDAAVEHQTDTPLEPCGLNAEGEVIPLADLGFSGEPVVVDEAGNLISLSELHKRLEICERIATCYFRRFGPQHFEGDDWDRAIGSVPKVEEIDGNTADRQIHVF